MLVANFYKWNDFASQIGNKKGKLKAANIYASNFDM